MIRWCRPEEIQIAADRQRQEFDADKLAELRDSIDHHGLLHPLVVRSTSSGLFLVAGERRLRAMQDLLFLGRTINCGGVSEGQSTSVPYITLGDLDPLAAEEAELDENLKRVDLTWQEQSAAESRLHSLRVAQSQGTQTIAETAKELYPDKALDYSRDLVRTSLILANHLENPEVAKAKSPKEAIKILRRQEETSRNVELAARVGGNYSSQSHTLVHTDCLEWLRRSNEDFFDVILIDPPYGINANEFGDGAGILSNNEHHYEDSEQSWLDLISELCPALFRVAKPQAHAYVFCDFDRFHVLKRYMQNAGWYVFRTPIINYKPRSGRVPLPEQGPRRQWEMCLYAIKGWKPVTAIYSDVITTVLEEAINHGAQKPVELYVDLLRRSIKPGDMVLDCFAGTGTIFPACHQLKCYATGVEISAEYYGLCVQRLKAIDDEGKN